MRRKREMIAHLVSLAAGVAVGCAAHYVLYRVSIPVNPFMYFFF